MTLIIMGCVVALIYLGGILLASHYYEQYWGPVCPECGADASEQAFFWLTRTLHGYFYLGYDTCDYCGTILAPLDPKKSS